MPSPTPSPQLIADRYRIISQLGEGGMGVVYRAWDNDRDVPVVVKMPKADKLSDPDFIERFNREIKAMAGLAHPHIVPIVGHGQNEDGRPYVAMRFLPGGSLSDRRRRGPDNKPVPAHPSLLYHWLPAIAEALDFVHRSGVIHRDVKPDNIFFDARWNAFLGDFGIAKFVAAGGGFEKDATITVTGVAVGTYAYTAPEVFDNKAVAGSDQYSLAITVYELLAGVKPFSGNLGEIIAGHINQLAPPLQDKNPKLSAQLGEAVHKSLSKKPEERFATCAQFAAAVLQGIPAPPEKEGVTRVMCPACHVMLDLDDKVAGKSGKCMKCRTPVWVSADLEAVWLLSENPAPEGQGDGKLPKTPSTFSRPPTGSMKSVVLPGIVVPPSAINLVPERVARGLGIFPLKVENGRLHVAIGDLMDGKPHENVRLAFPDHDIEFSYAPDWEIAEAITRYYAKPATDRSNSGATTSRKPQADMQLSPSTAVAPSSSTWLQPLPPHSPRRWWYFAAMAMVFYFFVSFVPVILGLPALINYVGYVIIGCVLISFLLALPTASLLVYLENSGPRTKSPLRQLGLPPSIHATLCEQLFRECRFPEAASLLATLPEHQRSADFDALLADVERLGVLKADISALTRNQHAGYVELGSPCGQQMLGEYQSLLTKLGLRDLSLPRTRDISLNVGCAPFVAIAGTIGTLLIMGRVLWFVLWFAAYLLGLVEKPVPF